MRKISLPWYAWTLYGINTVFFGLALYRWNQSDLRTHLRAEATVIDVVRHEDSSGDTTSISYSPIFRFIDSRTGEEVEAHCMVSEGRYGDDDANNRSSYYWIGRTFNILYKPENPSYDVRIDSFRGNGSLGCLILAAFGGIVTLASILAR